MLKKTFHKSATGLVVLAAVASALVVPGSAVAASGGPIAADPRTVLVEQATTTSSRARRDGAVGPATWYLHLRNKDGRAEVFWRRAADTHLMHRYELRPGGLWSADYSLGGNLLDDVFTGSSNADGRLEIFVRGLHDRALWHIWQKTPGGDYGKWETLRGELGGYPFASQWSDNFGIVGIVIDALGSDGNWWQIYQEYRNCCWTQWHRP